MKRTGTSRRKTRSLYRKNINDRCKISIRRYLQKLENGDKVLLKTEPAIQTGMYFRRFHGKIGTVSGKQGTNYKVTIKENNKLKELIIHPVHLIKCQTKE